MSTNYNSKTGRSTNFLLTLALFAFTVFSGFNASASNLEKSSAMAPLTGCTVPMSITASTIAGTSVTATWPAITGAAWFNFQYRVAGAATWTSGGTTGGASTSKTISGLTPSTNYELRGRINCTSAPATSLWSSIVTFSTPALSGCELPPIIASSAITGTTFTLSWPAVTAAAFYSFRYKVTGTATWTNGGTAGGAATSKNFIGFTPNTSYDVEARSHCAGSFPSAYSSIVVVMADSPTSSLLEDDAVICLGESTPLTVTITGGTSPYTVVYKVGAAYTTVSGYVSGTDILISPTVSGVYELFSVTDANGYVGIGNSGTATITVNTPAIPSAVGTYTDTKMIADGATADFASGCDIMGSVTDAPGGNVLGSTEMNYYVTPSSVTDPNGYNWVRRIYDVAPTSNGASTVTLYFEQSDFTDYNTVSGGAFLAMPTSGDNADPNLPFVRLVTFNTITGTTGLSLPLGSDLNWNGTHWVVTTTVANTERAFSLGTQPSCAGVNVSGLAVTAVTGTAVAVSWSPVITTPSYGDYSFRYREVGTTPWTNGGSANNATTAKTIVGLTAGLDYELQIRRNCSFQSSGDWSTSVTFTTPITGCGVPMTITSPVTTTSNSATIDWTAVTGAGWYELRYKESASGTWISAGTAPGGVMSKLISGLMATTSYDVQGRTFCPNGAPSAWSGTETFTTPSAGGCSLAPALTISAVTETSATADWTAVAGAGWYAFQYKESASGTWIFGGTASGAAITKTWNGLTDGTMYDLQARTYCPNGIPSDWSATVNFTTVILPSIALNSGDKDPTSDVADKGLTSTNVVGVYPNPVVDIVNIAVEFETADENATIKLMDMNGRVVREMNVTSVEGLNTFNMNMTDISSGMYTMFVYSNNSLLMTSKVKKN